MSGNPTGGQKAAQTNIDKYGKDFYNRIGKLGGQKSRGGGFAADAKRASEAGAKGAKVRWAKQRAAQEEATE